MVYAGLFHSGEQAMAVFFFFFFFTPPLSNQIISHKAETCYRRKYRLYFCHTCFSMGDLSVQVSVFCTSVHLSVHPFIHLSTFILVFWAQHLLQFYADRFETLHAFSSWYEDVHVVSILIFSPSIYRQWVPLVSATPLAVLYWSFWNFACVVFMVWGCAHGLDIIVKSFFSLLFLHYELSHFSPSVYRQ